MLKVKNLHVTFGKIQAVRGVSFEVSRGETVGIVGESGSGKTSAVHAITGLLSNAQITGGVSFENESVKRVIGRKIGMVFQSPMSSLNPTMKIGKQIAEGMIYHRFKTKKQASILALELLKLVGIDESRANQYPHQFSGGQRQRIAIAIALACNPKLLIADEPTTALDAIVQNQILDLLLEIQKKLCMSMVLISHDLKMIGQVCDRILVFLNGEIIEEGKTKDILSNPCHPYTKLLLNSRLSLIKRPKITTLDWVEFKNISKFYRKFKALDNVSFSIRKGEFLAIIGESGCGKSTLAKIIMGLISQNSGKIELSGEKKRFQMIFQDPYSSLNPRMKVSDILEEPTRIHKLPSRVDELLKLVSLEPSIKMRYPHELSGGQRQRVGIARAIALNPELLVCDEPVSSLDLTIQSQIIKLLLKLKDELNLSLVFISHNLPLVSAIADRIAVMKEGKILEIDTPDQLKHPYSKDLFMSYRGSPDKEPLQETSQV